MSGDRGQFGDLLASMGSAVPAPLFFVDPAGHSHALNALARLPAEDAASQALLSPVGDELRRGHVVAYVRPEDAAERGALLSALVALTARVMERGLAADLGAPRLDPALDPEDPVVGDEDNGVSCEADDNIATALVMAAARAVGARVAIAWVRGEDASRLEPRGVIGLEHAPALVVGEGLLGWAAERNEPTTVTSPQRLAIDAPRHEAGACPHEPWLDMPFAAIPLRCGNEAIGLLLVSGLPRVRGRDVAREAALRLATLADAAAGSLLAALLRLRTRERERVRRELDVAAQIQRGLLPVRSLSFHGIDVAGESRAAAEVGGDWYGVRAASDDELLITVLDAVGHGMGAALCMTLVRTVLRAETARGGSPAEVLTRSNRLAWEDLSESGLHATALLLRLDARTGRLEHASAGHVRPIHWSAASRRFVDRREGGAPLGLFADSAHAGCNVAFGAGDLLVLYTDGIVEATDESGEAFGRARLVALAHRMRRRPAGVVLRALWRAVDAFRGARPLRDDATLVVVKAARCDRVTERRSVGERRDARATNRPGRGSGRRMPSESTSWKH
jgi:serine phosphatase RsbU (regulator of sigma subunit)